MINLYIGQISNPIYCTPDENSDVAISFYYFKFVNRVTKDIVEMWLQNISTTERFQKFVITTDDFFNDKDGGMWTYTIQASNNNVVPTSDILETGYMYLHTEITEPVKYNEQSNTFKTYNG
jgi:hypothetical protein